jgi:succinate-semialdehyde dehydrogenase/glutarate-semialdehyde dehydrogenase
MTIEQTRIEVGQNFIGVQWQSEPETTSAISPATGETIGVLPRSTRETAQRAIAAARAATRGWAETPVWTRAETCMAIADAIEAARDRLLRILSLEQGKPTAEAGYEVGAAASGFRLAAELVKQLGGETIPTRDPSKTVLTLRQPRGVYAVVTPWNFPVNIPVEYLGPAIATGNAVVWVPAPTTSLCAVELMRCLIAGGLPPGVVNLVIGEGAVVGDEIVSNPGTDGIGFTGSSVTGRRIAERGAGKPMLLEQGGNGPVVVFDDCDLDKAAAATARGCFFNAGQVCAASERILVQRGVARVFAEKLAAIAATQVLGDPRAEGTTMGPLNNPAVAQKTREHVADAVQGGAEVLAGGKPRPDLGSPLYFEPTVLFGVKPSMRINREETFGPVAPIIVFDTEEEALAVALENDYGLTSSVFTRDLSRALRFGKAVPAGIVVINDAPTYWELHIPFGGGIGKRSGVGRLGGRHTLEAMTEIKTIAISG